MICESRVFLKSKTRVDRKRLSKSKVSTAFCQNRKIAPEKFIVIVKKDLPISYLLKESALILEHANRSYGGLKLSVFVTKQGPFCPISAHTFWKYVYKE